MYFHGGGWVLGSKNTHARLLMELTRTTNAAYAFVNSTPSPEAQFPAPVEEAYAAICYLVDHASALKLDPACVAVAGDSAGGNMATAVALLAKQRGGPKLRFQVLFYPVTNSQFDTPSYNLFGDGPWLTRPAMQWFWNAYAPDSEARKNITASPLLATLEDLSQLPPALIITAENDVLRDEGEAYADRLGQAGVDVMAVRFLGTIHDFAMLNSLSGTPAARGAVALASQRLRQALGISPC